MGFLDWIQQKSSDKCRDNITRGIPMFVEVCQRIGACQERLVRPSDADVKEGQRLFDMLWLNITNKSLPPLEIVAIFEPWLSRSERFSTYTYFQLHLLSGMPLVLTVQERLKAARFDPGRLDGILRPETHDAIRSFQNAKGLPATGEMDEATFDALGIH